MPLTVDSSAPQQSLTVDSSAPTGSRNGQVFWRGENGELWLQDTNGQTTNLGSDGQVKSWDLILNGAQEIANPNSGQVLGDSTSIGSYTAPPKVLDTAQLGSLDSLIGSLSTTRDQGVQKAALKRDEAKSTKEQEKMREENKYNVKKLSNLQDFAGAKTDTDLNTRNTLENLVSSLSTLGLGGSRALTRQILDAANMSNRKANATQATNNQGLDSAFNQYSVGNKDDMKKINDQYGFDSGEAEKAYLQQKQNALYKKADVYNAVNDTSNRSRVMGEADSLNGLITGATFLNPSYTGTSKEMPTPELSGYTQDIAKYDTTNIGATNNNLTPVVANGINAPGNLAVRAVAVNDKDLGIKKKAEASLGYGV